MMEFEDAVKNKTIGLFRLNFFFTSNTKKLGKNINSEVFEFPCAKLSNNAQT